MINCIATLKLILTSELILTNCNFNRWSCNHHLCNLAMLSAKCTSGPMILCLTSCATSRRYPPNHTCPLQTCIYLKICAMCQVGHHIIAWSSPMLAFKISLSPPNQPSRHYGSHASIAILSLSMVLKTLRCYALVYKNTVINQPTANVR